MPELDALDLQAKVAKVLSRWPSAGLAVGIVCDGSLEWFSGHGVANLESKEPIIQDTVFRIGSITKTVTAIAVMQLWEQGLVDLDAPANDYLRTFRLVPAKASFRPATVHDLLTHSGGIGYWRRLSDLLQPGVGSGNRAGRSGAPSLADYYRAGLPVEVEPGTKWAYTNHGFATWASWSRTSAASLSITICASMYLRRWGWSTPTWSGPSGSGPSWPPGTCYAPVASRRWPTARS